MRVCGEWSSLAFFWHGSSRINGRTNCSPIPAPVSTTSSTHGSIYGNSCIAYVSSGYLNKWGAGGGESMKSTPCCPRCYAQLVIRRSLLTTYLACPNYPNCKSPVQLQKHSEPAREYCRAA